MAEQEEGWPLGLEPVNARVRNTDLMMMMGSISFNTLLTLSPTTSTDSSSDLDTQSTGSFFHDRSSTLGSLIGVKSILELSRRSLKRIKSEPSKEKTKTAPTTWCFSLCPKISSTEAESPKIGKSLGQFLAVERKSAIGCRRNSTSHTFDGLDELELAQTRPETNSLFLNGRVAPPRLSSGSGIDHIRRDRIIGQLSNQ